MEKSHEENLITEQQYILSHSIYYIIFPPTVNTVIYCISKKLREQTIFDINTHFMIRTTYVEFQTSTTIIWQGNLISDH